MQFWKEKNVFVTGATGLLGSWITKELVKKGANVTILCRDWVPKSKLIWDKTFEEVNVVRGELENYHVVLRALNEYEIDSVFHLGAQTIVTIANRNPIGTFKSNIEGTWNVLEACRKNKLVERIVIASTDKAYGTQRQLPYTEKAPLQGEHPYDVSKSCADLIARSYFLTYRLPVAVTRCGNLYGAGDLNFNRIIPGTIKSILLDERPVIRSDGTFIRDYLYLQDAVDGYLLLAKKLNQNNVKGEAFNFSTKNKLRVIDVVNKIIDIMVSKLKPRILNQASDEIREQYLSSKKAKHILGWEAKYDLEKGLKATIPWYKKIIGKS
jgi:CDP-glucose 4,6-dehydratase